MQSSPAGPTGGTASGPSELERKPATGMGDAEATERTENLEDNGSRRDGVCG